MNQTPIKSREQVMNKFEQLLAERKKNANRILTKEEMAQEKSDLETAEKASNYTLDGLVKGLADLQLEFGESTAQLAQKLKTEYEKLRELKTAIAFKKKQLQEIEDAQLAADAMHVLEQEHESRKKQLQTEIDLIIQKLEEEIIEKRTAWEKEMTEFKNTITQRKTKLQKERDQEVEAYRYEWEMMYKKEADQQTEINKQLERELAETEKNKEKDWNKREKILEKNQSQLEEYKNKVENFENELKDAIQKARQDAIQQVQKDAKIKAELFEKEMEGNQKLYESKISTLEKQIEQQATEIEKLNAELKATLVQVQALSLKAIENNTKNK
ncbi:MAG: hypothetical protein EAZ55_12965 [Cytophagales bacterium]|nr:MAG: hypothetical protein EAZ55_12965 [Cytophagales bacterium]